MSLVKTALDTDFSAVGDTLDYEYLVTNTGNVTINSLVVTDDLIATVTCPVTTLAPGANTTCTATYTVTQTDLDAGSVTNNAEGTGTPSGGTLPPATDDETVNGTQTPEIALVKTALDTDYAAVGDTLDYEYLVTNTGNVSISGITVTDDKIASISCPSTTLAPTASMTCTGTYTVTQADIDAGSVLNNADANGTPAGGTLTPAEDDATVTGTQSPAMDIVKTALTTNYAAVGDTLDYEYLVTNTGNVTLTSSISVVDNRILPPNVVTCPALPAGGLVPTDSITCTATYTVTQADLDAGSVTNIAMATDGTTDSPTDDAVVNGTQSPAMTLVKTPVETSYTAVGDTISYNYTVENTGNVLIANLVVTDNLIPAVTCNVSGIGNGDANFDPGEVVVCTGSYTVTQADLDAGSITNTAEADGDPSGGTLTPPETDATVDADQQPALEITKTANETTFAAVGDVLTYDYTVENTGNVYVTNIAVDDDKISSVTCDVTAVGNNDANLDPGETVICTGSYSVTQADLDAGEVVNIADATGDSAGGDPVEATDTETVDGQQLPSMGIVKTATDVNFTLPGDITTYSYVVTNDGNVTLTAPITVTDNLISPVNCPALPTGGLVPGDFITCTGQYTVTQADLDSGSVTNLASASDGTTDSPQTSETIPGDQNPALTIEKAALFSDFTAAGEVVTYEFTVTNSGNLTLTGGVNVVDDKIGTFLCITGNFVPGDTQTCTATYTVTQADMDAGSITNQAYAQNGSIVSPPDDVTVEGTISPSMAFEKRETTGTFTDAGDVLTYEFDVENTGNVTLTGVSISDPLISVSCPQSTLDPAETMLCTASYTVTQADVDAGEVLNTATVSGNAPDGSSVDEDDSETTDSTPNPGLSFAKRAMDTSYSNAGDILDYEFDVENTGSITLSNIVISDSLTTVSCPLTVLAPAQSMICTASYTVTQADVDAGSVTNSASASSELPDGSDGPGGDDSVDVDADINPSMSILKDAVVTDYSVVGDILSYTYLVTNTGNVTITNIDVTDNLIPSLSCPGTTLAPAANMTCTGSYTVTQADIDAGSVTNIAEATGDPAGGTLPPVTDDETVDGTQLPAMEVVKTALTPDYDTVGDTIDYEYVVTNTGNVTITDPISVSDNLIATVNCPPIPSGGLIPTDSLTCTATYVVTQADIDAGSVTNTASATDGTTTSPETDETVDADQNPAMTVVKTATTATYNTPGDVISYTYEVVNSGNTTIVDPITVSDDRIPSVSCPALPAGGLAPMDTITCTGDYTVTQADIDAGDVVNIASATDGTTTSPEDDETVPAEQTPALGIEKTAVDVNFEMPGDITTYNYVVTNTGNVTITAPITVTDNLIGTVPCPALPAGGLLPGDAITCVATYAATQSDLDNGSVTNVATASDGTTTSPPDSETIPALADPALTMRKSTSDTTFNSVGDILTYTFEIENMGNLTLTGDTVIVDDKIGTFVCFSGNIPPGAMETCTATYAVTQADIDAGFVTNNAYAENPMATSPPDDATVDADQTPEITVEKTALTTSYDSVGDILNYEFEVTNTGNTTITLPISVTDSEIPSVSCPALPSGGLAPGDSITCSGSDTVTQADLDAGFVTNTASASDGDTTSDEVEETVSGDQTVDFTVDKVAQSTDYSAVGDVLSYDYLVQNTGNVTMTAAVTINDDIIGVIACPALPAGGLVPGDILTCSATYTVTQADIDAGSVTNIATAESGGDTSDPDTVTIEGTQTPELVIEKSTTATSYTAAGEILTYSYAVTNTGNVTITDPITVTDDLIPTVSCPALPSGGLVPGDLLTCTGTYTVTQADVDAGSVTNIASASDGTTTSDPDDVTVPADQESDLAIEKTALDTSFSVVGDILSYEYVVTNVGNTTLFTPVTVTDDKIPVVNCPALPTSGLLPNGTITCSGDYTVTQADLDSGEVINIASASSGDTTSPTDTVTVDAVLQPTMDVSKSVTQLVQVGGPIYDVTYDIVMENTGNVTLNGLQLQDDLVSFLAPATLYNPPSASISGFTGGSVNTSYDGSSDIDLLSGSPSLPVGDSGVVTINMRIDTTNGGPAQGNTAYGNADELSDPVPSDDPTETPNDDDDTNPTPLDIEDTDGDGAPDNYEDPNEDRDGDGIPDSEDYDPTGYFYCEENGQILSGGGISISGPAGSNASIGTLNNIVIVEDGSDGYYQFYVTAPGRYVLTPTYPTSGAVSTSRPVQNVALDVTSYLPANPAILGSSEVGSSGELADYSAAVNSPFYFEFDFEPGDPALLLNNIPLQHCGVSNMSLSKTVAEAPVTLDDGRQLVSYNFEVNNTGETRIDNIQITDNLGNVYGPGNVTIDTNIITAEPVGFGGDENPAYDGVVNVDLLDGLGDLNAGESLIVNLQAIVAPETASTFINKASVSGDNPLTGDPVTDDDTADLELSPAAKVGDLRVTKSAQPRTVQIGDPVLYTIDVTNSSGVTATGLDIVDNLPQGFAYVPNTAVVTDGTTTLEIEPNVVSSGQLRWSIAGTQAPPLDVVAPGETISVSMRLLAGPNVDFGAHENQAYAQNTVTGERSEIASAVVDYIPEPSFDCTPVIGRAYDDVNHNGYPDDGEPGLPAVRLVTVNGDIITTDSHGRYHIPCAAIADSEFGSNFLLKVDTRTLPLGYATTTENPRVIRATRGKFVKMNFGAAFRPKLRIDMFATDFEDGFMLPHGARRIKTVLDEMPGAERALIVYHALDGEDVNMAQSALSISVNVVKELAPRTLDDIALEASWGDAKAYEDTGAPITGKTHLKDSGLGHQDHVAFQTRRDGSLVSVAFLKDGTNDDEGDLRGEKGSKPLASDDRKRSIPLAGRRDRGDDESARPGRLMRWIGWGNKTASYAESLEIETTTDSLDVVKRLNAQLDIVRADNTRMIMAEAYHNYEAFTDRLEIRLFNVNRSVRGEPLAVMPVTDGQARLEVMPDMPDAMVYVLRAYGEDGQFDQTAPKSLRIGDTEYDLTPEEWKQQAYTAFGQSTLIDSNIKVRGGSVRVYGRNVPGETVTVMNQVVRVDDSGRFVAEQLLPSGEQTIDMWVAGQDNSKKRIARLVDVKSRDTFYVAQAEATIGNRIGSDTDTFNSARLAFYVRSRLNDRWSVTATADTGEAEIENLFNGLDDKDLGQLLRRLDPDKYYPTYGDDSTIEQDAPTSGRIYARVERDDDYLLWGNYQTNFSDTEYGRVQRTLYGAKLHWDENGNMTKFGDDRTTLSAYFADGGSRQARDELQGTGGSVYYFRHGDISIGSEILRVETRDVISGQVLESRRLVYGIDYDLDFIQGRVILNQPLSSTGDDGRLFRDGSQSGNEKFLVATYEYSPIASTSSNSAIYGIRGARWFGDHFKVGATYNHDTDGAQVSDLFEIDATLQLTAGTYIKGEIAQTKGQGVETYRSVDGGFTYNPQDRGGLVGNDSVLAYAVEAAADWRDISDIDGSSYAYWRQRGAGFAGYGEATNDKLTNYGGGFDAQISEALKVSGRMDISDDQTIGTNSFAEATVAYALTKDIDLRAGLSYNNDTAGNSGTSLGARADYTFDDDSNIYVFGQVGLDGRNTRTTDRIGIGGEYRLNRKLFGGGEISTGEDGLGVRASIRRQSEDGDEQYIAYDLPLQSQVASNYGTFNLGARHRFSDVLSVFGEERFQFNDTGLYGLTHAYGIDYKPGNWNFNLAGEVGQIDDLDRIALSAGVGFASDRMQAGLTGEWREDENQLTGDIRKTWLMRTTALYQASEELRLQGKLNMARSSQDNAIIAPIDFNEAVFTEASLAAAYRPIWDDRFNLLAKVVWLEDLSPTSQRFNGEFLNYRQRSSIVSIDGSYDLLPRLTVGAKYGHRSGEVTSNRTLLDFTKSEADLGVVRFDYHATHKWDALLEGRYLNVGDGTIVRTGGLAGIYRHLNDNAKLGVGITWGGIEEEYLAAQQDEDIGWFINLVGKF